jgi:hypothetical protein
MFINQHRPRFMKVVAIGSILASLSAIGSADAGEDKTAPVADPDKTAPACTISESDAQKSAHEYVDLYLTGENNFLLLFNSDWGPNGTKKCAEEPFLKEFSDYEIKRAGRSDLTYGFPPHPATKGYYTSIYTDAQGKLQGFELNLVQIYVHDSLVALKKGAGVETVSIFVQGHLSPESAALFVELFNKTRGGLNYKSSVFGDTHVNIIDTTE